jgi:hypothetical protein
MPPLNRLQSFNLRHYYPVNLWTVLNLLTRAVVPFVLPDGDFDWNKRDQAWGIEMDYAAPAHLTHHASRIKAEEVFQEAARMVKEERGVDCER